MIKDLGHPAFAAHDVDRDADGTPRARGYGLPVPGSLLGVYRRAR